MIDNPHLSPSEQLQVIASEIKTEGLKYDLLRKEIGKVIVGQENMVRSLLIALLADGHVLLEGVPGLAKTLAIRTLSSAVSGDFSRIQFTPDLLPADVTGTLIYQQKSEQFAVKKGPIFANFVLADEINRAPAKVQAALLEAMQERQVTIGDSTYPLPRPFLVLATQNPIEQEGTYPLPEAQVDRFMLKVFMGYPSKSEEQLILRSNVRPEGLEKISHVMNPEDLIKGKHLTRSIYLDEKVERYIVDIVDATRNPANAGISEISKYLLYGASPRASINLALAAKANAFLEQRAFVIPDDVRTVAMDVLRHRIGLNYEAEADGVKPEQIIERLLQRVEVP
ncbi:AAA family ATPase [Fluviicola taffensis]|uniref:ATPase associated with various cellular activities AAA_3 n=1 Tax=Fluviicola taffensis (strain DSM 16823 / NCIMB 13979 / RW262) TaxID=755732 RepID=F2IJN9_FLUTR|nr:AAA family ATPase [Fluviicola taffensis]AEA43929.1 ATPase associated with various cellular activities AAA_3 [Fluviicola taffensis DSM 16823]